jgi:hypothetical protein
MKRYASHQSHANPGGNGGTVVLSVSWQAAPRAIVEHNFLTMVAVDSHRRLQPKGFHSCGSQSLYLRFYRQRIATRATPSKPLLRRWYRCVGE